MINDKEKKLGKGLSSLLSGKSFSKERKEGFIDTLNTELKVGIIKIKPNPNQPRKNFNKEELTSLALSIKEKGVIQPVLVRKDANSDEYEIIAGERRWRAGQIAGINEIPVIIKNLNDQEMIEIAIIENVQRENLNPVEEAEAYNFLLNKYKYNQDQLSKNIGKSRSHITNMLRLLDLPTNVLELLANNKVTIGHVRPLIGLKNANDLVKIIIEKKLSVRQSEKLAKNFKAEPSKSKGRIRDPNIKDLENELSEKIGLKTTISFSDKSTAGSITVYYSNLDQLDDIMRRLKDIKK